MDRFRAGVLATGLLLLMLAGSVQAVVVDRLYDAVVPVEDTGAATRDDAFREALRQVLVRLTGDPGRVRGLVSAASGNETGERSEGTLVDEPARFIDAFSYQRNGDQLELRASVSASALGRALAERDVPVWGAMRPRILVWFVVDDRGKRQLVTRDNQLPPFLERPMQPLNGEAIAAESGPWKEPLWEVSRRRGLPLALPFKDSRDRGEVRLSELWGLFVEPIHRASQRYAHDLVAVVRVDRSGGGWRARWQLWRGSKRMADGVVRKNNRPVVVRAVADAWADRLAQRYAVGPPTEDGLRSARMLVDGVGSLESYAGVRQSLRALEPVRSVRVGAVHQDRLSLDMAFNGDLRLLHDYIGLEDQLVLMGGPPDGAITAPGDKAPDSLRLYYRWTGDPGRRAMLPGNGEAQAIIPSDSGDGGGGSGALRQ
ncbi:DUF2066 domain-containing protein [Halomonadaceae bacterium KBTZ08]